jgi:hypothetical protein
MQFTITNDAALLFAHSFYGALARGHGIDTAVAAARPALFAEYGVEFGTPVLFANRVDLHLFGRPASDSTGKPSSDTAPVTARVGDGTESRHRDATRPSAVDLPSRAADEVAAPADESRPAGQEMIGSQGPSLPAALNRGGGDVDLRPALAAARVTAALEARDVDVVTEGPLRAYVSPDGAQHWAFGYPAARPPNPTRPSNLCGAWALERGSQSDVVELRSDGTVGGHLQLFGALPPLPITGAWWWDAAQSTLTYEASANVPEVDEFPWLMHYGIAIRLTHISENVLVGTEQLEGKETSLYRTQPAMAPSG